MLAPLNLTPILLLAHKFGYLNHIVDGAIAAIRMAAGRRRARTINQPLGSKTGLQHKTVDGLNLGLELS